LGALEGGEILAGKELGAERAVESFDLAGGGG
jgi:hypothetical protein